LVLSTLWKYFFVQRNWYKLFTLQKILLI
jgi:hypothetical protein